MTSNVTWIKFKDREGPVTHGSIRYELPKNPTANDVWLATTVACEGSSYDAVNMYDRGIISLGLLQWAEHVGKATKLLGYLSENGLRDHMIATFDPIFKKTNVSLSPYTFAGKKRWCFTYFACPITTPESTQETILGCDGVSSSWTDEKRSTAIEWAQTFNLVLSHPLAVKLQERYAREDVYRFVPMNVRVGLFEQTTEAPIVLATRALYVAMAVNSPLGAQNAYAAGVKLGGGSAHFTVLKTPSGNVPAQFARRYAKAKPIVEKAYGITLP